MANSTNISTSRKPNRFDGLLDKLLIEQEKRRRAGVFHRSSYWMNWSRVLAFPGDIILDVEKDAYQVFKYSYLEVNLTPIAGCHDSSWEKDVLPIIVHLHGTAPGRVDRFLPLEKLPSELIMTMNRKLGETVTEVLLHEDLLAEINFDKLIKRKRERLSSYLSGGIPLADII